MREIHNNSQRGTPLIMTNFNNSINTPKTWLCNVIKPNNKQLKDKENSKIQVKSNAGSEVIMHYLKEEPTKVRAHRINFVSSKFMLCLPHILLLLHIFDEAHSKLKNLKSPEKQERIKIARTIRKIVYILKNEDERSTIKEKPCIQCRYRWHEPRTETIVARGGIHHRAFPESL